VIFHLGVDAQEVGLVGAAGDDVVREGLGVILAIRKLVLWAEEPRWQKERVRRIEEKQRKEEEEHKRQQESRRRAA